MKPKQRPGGLAELRDRVLDGDVRAMRALLRQASGPNTLELSTVPEMRAVPNGTGGDRLLFEGIFCKLDYAYEREDWLGPYVEQIHSGALTRTINAGPDVTFVNNHDWNAVPMARTTAGSLDLAIDGSCQARIDGDRADVNIVRSALEGEEIASMSFAFWVTDQAWSPDYEQRDIFAVDMDFGDVSTVTHPGNPGTTGSTSI
jgi:HK97 family phage prohead protease